MDILKKIPHRHFVFSIPKILRRYFLYDRKLLADLSLCAWESLKVFLQEAVPENDPIPGAVIAMQTFGDFLGYNPHCHIQSRVSFGKLLHDLSCCARRANPEE